MKSIGRSLILTVIFFVGSIYTAPIYAQEITVKGEVEEIEIKEQTEESTVAKVKIRLLEGDYLGTSMYTDYSGDITLEQGDEVFVKEIIAENDLQKIEIVGYNRSSILIWLVVLAGVLLLSIFTKGIFSQLFWSISLIAFVLMNWFSPVQDKLGVYLGTAVIITLIVIIGNIVRHGLSKFTLISVLGSVAGITVTGILQSSFAQGMKLTSDNLELMGAGVLVASAGIITSNAAHIAFGIKDSLEGKMDVKRSEVLQEGISLSRSFSSSGINVLVWSYTGLLFPTIIENINSNSGFGLFNNSEMASVAIAILSSATGILIVPILTTILAFIIIDVNRLGKRVPVQKQMEMKM